MNLRTALRTTALGAAMLLGGAMLPGATAQARDRDDRCFERIRNEERKLDRDIERHGRFSRQAEHDRRKIRELREGCRFQGRGWGGWGRRRGDGDNDRDDRGRNWHRRDGDRDRDNRGRNWRHREWERERNEGRDRDNR